MNLPFVLKYKNEYVVLDGTHKLSAKKLLEHSTAKVQLIEYFDD